MSTTTDRGAVHLALEYATKLRVALVGAGVVGDTMDETAVLLSTADALLSWHDARVAERSSRDELKRKAPIPIDMGGA